ncbi:MAG: DUF4407 domain-containing protein [Saprospiraceae bacterium]|nr:DUF4407 domain-containing protein [Saprospiraceae bacterium]
MKSRLYDMFVWLAGSDRSILDRCGQSEHIKHGGYGGLVIVPALLGWISMTYAVSTLTDSKFVYIFAGIAWAFIVLVFDRFIVSTFRKSEKIRTDVFSAVFIVRLLFSVGIGILVSHPLVILVFNDSLIQELTTMQIEGEEAINQKYEIDIQKVRGRDSLLNASLDAKTAERACKEKLLLYEMSGKDTTMFCGTTSGMKQYGPRSREIKSEISLLNEEMATLRAQNAVKLDSNAVAIAKIERTRDTKLEEFRNNYSDNYLAREIALERLESHEVGGRTVALTKWFLMLFFILVDILPVTFKALTKTGEYDRHLLQEDKMPITITNAYERHKKNETRKVYVDEIEDLRRQKIKQEIQGVNGTPFRDLLKRLEEYLG